MNHKHWFRRVYIIESALQDSVTSEILSKFPRRIQRIIPDDYNLAAEARNLDPKTILLLTRSQGDIVKGCPGTDKSYLCCNYQVINQTQNCPMHCSYCILQFYLNQPATVLYTNYDDIFVELKQKITRQPKRFFRIGTGELGDSLAIDGTILFAEQAIRVFAEMPNTLLELKSKTADIDDLLHLEHNGHTVLAWSLNPQEIIHQNELKTAQLIPRLAAAQKAVEAGYLLAFHFDPILFHSNWEKLYSELIDELYMHVDPERIAWISLGSLRFPPSMKEKIIERYPNTIIPFAEMVRGTDGKLRYARPLRLPMYKLIYEKLSTIPSAPFIYFCMESPLIWKEVFGKAPDSNSHLDFMFADSLFRRFPGLMPEKPQRIHYDNGFSLDTLPE
ncbi:MAG: DNA photolyase [Candidatus Marinimicrobia bacterium]|nr:DNA photolyase [Candidatus Neomarinimicrobiota bacterium]